MVAEGIIKTVNERAINLRFSSLFNLLGRFLFFVLWLLLILLKVKNRYVNVVTKGVVKAINERSIYLSFFLWFIFGGLFDFHFFCLLWSHKFGLVVMLPWSFIGAIHLLLELLDFLAFQGRLFPKIYDFFCELFSCSCVLRTCQTISLSLFSFNHISILTDIFGQILHDLIHTTGLVDKLSSIIDDFINCFGSIFLFIC